MKITYVGPAESVDIAVPGGSIRAVNGVPVEVPAELGSSLLEQDVFVKVTKEKN
jgi:hypothetical protein